MLPYVIPVITLLIGWWAKMLQTRHEDNKSINRVLFNLLTIHYYVSRADTSRLLKLLVNIARKQFPEIPNNEQAEIILNTFAERLMPRLLAEMFDFKMMEKTYKESIESLALLKPVIAFRLEGNTNFIKLCQTIGDYPSIFKKELAGDASQTELNIRMANKVKSEFFSRGLAALEIDLINLSGEINWYHKFKMKKRLVDAKRNEEKELNEKINEFIDKMKPQFDELRALLSQTPDTGSN
jgi:hypothetical protein